MKNRDKIIPMMRRKFGVSKTAKREQDWKYISVRILLKSIKEKFLRSIGK